ncbi:MAG: primosomal protein N' [Lachnospiraceae bacterium]
MYAKVIVDITHEKLDKIFEYSIPGELEGMLKVGTEVLVPFGRGNREMRGYVVGFSDVPEYAPEQIKEILKCEEDKRAIESKLVALAAWMKETYGGTMIQALKTVLPIKTIKKTIKKKRIRLLLTKEEGKERMDFYLNKNQKARARVLAGLLEQPEQEYGLLTKKLNISPSVINALKEQGVLEITEEQAFRNPVKYQKKEEKEVLFTPEQKNAADTFKRDYDSGQFGTYLLYGVTGSGKTEVYMEMIQHVVKKGRQAIVLIPEIALTYQTVLRFYGKFGERVSILNSRLSGGERSDQIERVKNGEVDVMIGPRSALFTPFKDLGLIVIDEEHEAAYKSEQVPRYHARETAIMRGKLENASVVLGSATPSLEAYYRCEKGEYTRLTLARRAARQALPSVYVTDMREELKRGNRSILSDRLKGLMNDRLKMGQQIMLFLNRRGYAGFVSCRSCGYVVKCPHCDVSLSSHKNGMLVCHYCGYEIRAVKKCPSCGSSYMGGFKAGTEAIEELIKREFPDAGVLRMDMDTTRTKEGHERILSAFADGEADILIGTQMIVKGHDFPNVTLVGILAADMSLYGDDYRSAERTFALLTQAAGRAGRGSIKGEVVIQTYNPEHYSIEKAAAQDYEGFYEKEMDYRRIMGYPPAAELLAVLVTGEDEKLLDTAVRYLKEFALRAGRNKDLQIIGPASPFVGKVNDIYRRVIYIKSKDYSALTVMKDHMEQYIEMNKGFQTLKIQFDFNPMNIF